MSSRWSVVLILALSVTLCATVLQARVCNGDSDLSGQYAFAAERAVFTNGLTGFPGLTGSTGTSGTGTGSGPDLYPGYTFRGARGLIVRTATGVPFEIEGTFWSDGLGNLFVFPGVNYMALTNTEIAGLAKQIQIGTYTVNSDCTVNMSFDSTAIETAIATADALAAGKTGTGGTSPAVTVTTPTTSTFEGILVENGEEVDLVQNDKIGGADLRLRHTIGSLNSCVTASLVGSFGLAAKLGQISTPTGTTGTGNTGANGSFPNVTEFPVFGQITADGQGNFIVPSANVPTSPPGLSQITGTYTVNPDCSGTASFTVGPVPIVASTTSTTPPAPGQPGSSINIEFVLPRIPAPGLSPGNYLPEIDFVFTGYAISGAAVAKPE